MAPDEMSGCHIYYNSSYSRDTLVWTKAVWLTVPSSLWPESQKLIVCLLEKHMLLLIHNSWGLDISSCSFQLTFSEPLALGAATASEFEVEPVQGRKVSKVVKTTVVKGERMEKQIGDASLAADLPSAREDFEKVSVSKLEKIYQQLIFRSSYWWCWAGLYVRFLVFVFLPSDPSLLPRSFSSRHWVMLEALGKCSCLI